MRMHGWRTWAALAVALVAARATRAQPVISFTDGDFSSSHTWTVVGGTGSGGRLATGGSPGACYGTIVETRTASPDCVNGCPDTSTTVFVVREQVFDPSDLGAPIEFASECSLWFEWEGFGTLVCGFFVEQGGYFFGPRGARNDSLPWRTWSTTSLNELGGWSSSSLFTRLPDGQSGGPSHFNPTGTAFRPGFWVNVSHRGSGCCQGATPCCQLLVRGIQRIDNWQFRFRHCVPPTFSTSPSDASVCPGSAATFTAASASSTGGLRWRRNGIPLDDVPGRFEGTHTGSLTILGARAEDAGSYDCLGTRSCQASDGSVVMSSAACNPAELIVLPAFDRACGGAGCDPDVNCDGVPDQDDIACLILAVAGDTGCFCQADPDFNHDGVPDQSDVADLVLVVAGTPCP